MALSRSVSTLAVVSSLLSCQTDYSYYTDYQRSYIIEPRDRYDFDSMSQPRNTNGYERPGFYEGRSYGDSGGLWPGLARQAQQPQQHPGLESGGGMGIPNWQEPGPMAGQPGPAPGPGSSKQFGGQQGDPCYNVKPTIFEGAKNPDAESGAC